VVGPAKWNPSPQSVSAAYWTLERGWNTDLEMRNNLRSRELTITPVLRAATGQELSLAPVTVAATVAAGQGTDLRHADCFRRSYRPGGHDENVRPRAG
jgi:hypothetical protein